MEVVDFILDLVDYTSDRPLMNSKILEPSFGRGDFLLPIVTRLIRSWLKFGGKSKDAFGDLHQSIRAVELHRETYLETSRLLEVKLVELGLSSESAAALVQCWLVQGDFLLQRQTDEFNFVVGNPPYVRREMIPASLLNEYKARYSTIYDRADLYIPFIEQSLSLLTRGGTLGFICADRWMKNRYGAPLREFVSRSYNLAAYIDMGYLRFQAQYLRRIRIPRWEDVSESLRQSLIAAASCANLAACNEAVMELYGLSASEQNDLIGSVK
jgi:hypothetical protein